MAARRRGRRVSKATRTQLHLSLTSSEIGRLEKQAAEDLRSVTNYLTRLLVEHLRRPRTFHGPVVKWATGGWTTP